LASTVSPSNWSVFKCLKVILLLFILYKCFSQFWCFSMSLIMLITLRCSLISVFFVRSSLMCHVSDCRNFICIALSLCLFLCIRIHFHFCMCFLLLM
jgi:hypothetical protein